MKKTVVVFCTFLFIVSCSKNEISSVTGPDIEQTALTSGSWAKGLTGYTIWWICYDFVFIFGFFINHDFKNNKYSMGMESIAKWDNNSFTRIYTTIWFFSYANNGYYESTKWIDNSI